MRNAREDGNKDISSQASVGAEERERQADMLYSLEEEASTQRSFRTRRSLADIEAEASFHHDTFLSNIEDIRVAHCDAWFTNDPMPSGQDRQVAAVGYKGEGVIGFVTLRDALGAQLSLVDSGNRFSSLFRKAQEEGRTFSLSNVLVRKHDDIYGKKLPTDEVILWPTEETAIVLQGVDADTNPVALNISALSSAVDGYVAAKPRVEQRKQDEQASQEESKPKSSSVDRSGRLPQAETNTNVMNHNTQYSSNLHYHTLDNQDDPTASHHYFALTSTIVDIFLHGTSLRQAIGTHSKETMATQLSLNELLLRADGSDYEEAMVKLEPIESLVVVDEEGHEVGRQDTFAASSEIVKALCGGISASEWRQRRNGDTGEGSATASSQGYSSQLHEGILHLLRAILQESVPLKWTVDLGRRPAEIVEVTFPNR